MDACCQKSPKVRSDRFLNRALGIFVVGYRWLLSPLFGPSCRFHPSCSEYALEALQQHNAAKALLLIVWRILRCNPFSKGGYDPVVPEKTSKE